METPLPSWVQFWFFTNHCHSLVELCAGTSICWETHLIKAATMKSVEKHSWKLSPSPENAPIHCGSRYPSAFFWGLHDYHELCEERSSLPPTALTVTVPDREASGHVCWENDSKISQVRYSSVYLTEISFMCLSFFICEVDMIGNIMPGSELTKSFKGPEPRFDPGSLHPKYPMSADRAAEPPFWTNCQSCSSLLPVTQLIFIK